MPRAFRGDPVLPFIKRWVRTCCRIGGEGWCSLMELRASYERFCREQGRDSDEYIKHDILPVLQSMGCRIRYGYEPGAFGITLLSEEGV
jgi:hypothetical protein